MLTACATVLVLEKVVTFVTATTNEQHVAGVRGVGRVAVTRMEPVNSSGYSRPPRAGFDLQASIEWRHAGYSKRAPTGVPNAKSAAANAASHYLSVLVSRNVLSHGYWPHRP